MAKILRRFNDGDLVLVSAQVDAAVEALLAALRDYSVDKRGDVGAWVREEAMRALPVAFGAASRFDNFLTADRCQTVLCALTKQMAEKIDRVRRTAAAAATQIATSPTARTLPFADAVVRACEGGGDWANPSECFGAVTLFLDMPPLRSSALSGLVISVGGLTAATTSAAWAALRAFCARSVSLGAIWGDLSDILNDNWRLDRVAVPTLRTIALMLDTFTPPPTASGAIGQILDASSRAACASKDVAKLVAVAAVAARVCGCGVAEVEGGALALGAALLGHPYPRVRAAAAEGLYVALLTSGKGGVNLLAEANWADDAEAAKGAAEFVRVVGVAPSGIEFVAGKLSGQGDEGGYGSLVRDAGY